MFLFYARYFYSCLIVEKVKRRFIFYIALEDKQTTYEQLIQICLQRVVEVETRKASNANASISIQRLKELKDYIIANIVVLDADSPDIIVTLEIGK